MSVLLFEKVETTTAIKIVSKKANEIWREHFTPIIGELQVEYMLNLFLSPTAISYAINEDGYEFYKIDKGGIMVGFFSIKQEKTRIFLSKLYIEKSFRGNGYAREALHYIVELAKRAGLANIWLTCNKYNEHTLAVYKRMGFKIFDEAISDIGHGYVMDDYYLEMNF